MELKPQTVVNSIKSWRRLGLPSLNRKSLSDNEQLAQDVVIAQEYFGELRDVYSDGEYKLAAKRVRRFTEFFPSIKALYEIRREIHEEWQRIKSDAALGLKQIGHDELDLTDEAREASGRRLEEVKAKMANIGRL